MPDAGAPVRAQPSLLRIWRALRGPRPDERPAGVARLRYRFPPRLVMAMGRDLALGRPRSFRADCALAVRLLPRRPRVDGLEHVPCGGSFVLVANHYQRRDLWIGWAGGLLCDALWKARPDLRCHLVVTDRAVLKDGAAVGWTRPLFARVAQVWDCLLVTPPEAHAVPGGTRSRALRRCLRKLQSPDARSVCLVIFPEGLRGGTHGLAPAARGGGRSLLALAATGAPILPAAVWEEQDGALHARFGPAWHRAVPADLAQEQRDAWAGEAVMARIAALLPPTTRGESIDGTDGRRRP